VIAQIWRVAVGRVPLFLLDADRPENGRLERWICSQPYVADPITRLSQYALLGVGGVRALAALGIELALVHLNEGHAAFAVLGLARAEVARGLPVEAALEVADGLLARPHARLDPHAGSRLLRWANARRLPPADLHADDHQRDRITLRLSRPGTGWAAGQRRRCAAR
jgi:hypothetical protein